MQSKKLIVIGGGAAGFFTAINAAKKNPALKVIILEKSGKLLSKVRVSGGGRCNVTHACFDKLQMTRFYPRGSAFLKKAFHHFFTSDTITWFEERGVKLKTESDGRMFPQTNSSETIAQCLLREAEKNAVTVITHTTVKSIEPLAVGFRLHTDKTTLETDYLCVACGGFPKAEQVDWLKQTGHTIVEPVPSLFTFNIPDNNITKLMGVSVAAASAKIPRTKLAANGPLLITHWGLSGPAILKLSAWGARELAAKNYQFNVLINWIPEYNESSLREEWPLLRQQHSGKKVLNTNPFALPSRLWEYILNESKVEPVQRWDELKSQQQNSLIQHLTMHSFSVKGKTTFKEEFVTAGGISLSEIDVNTMQSKLQKGLFFAGEILDVDGITGGFNFQNAWTTGWIAANAISDISGK